RLGGEGPRGHVERHDLEALVRGRTRPLVRDDLVGHGDDAHVDVGRTERALFVDAVDVDGDVFARLGVLVVAVGVHETRLARGGVELQRTPLPVPAPDTLAQRRAG